MDNVEITHPWIRWTLLPQTVYQVYRLCRFICSFLWMMVLVNVNEINIATLQGPITSPCCTCVRSKVSIFIILWFRLLLVNNMFMVACIFHSLGVDLIRQGWSRKSPNVLQEGYGSAAVLPEQGIYLAASIYRPVIQVLDLFLLLLPEFRVCS